MKRSSGELKRFARELLQGRFGVPMVSVLIFYFAPNLLLFPFQLLLQKNQGTLQSILFSIVSLIIALITTLLAIGMFRIHLSLARTGSCQINDILWAFSHAPLKFIWATIRFSLLVLLCGIPFFAVIALAMVMHSTSAISSVVYGILMAISIITYTILTLLVTMRYALVFFLLLDAPQAAVRDAFHESSRLMKGNVGRYFYLILSFLGWNLLALLTCGIGYLWVYPYMMQTYTNFYLDVNGELDRRFAAQNTPTNTFPPTVDALYPSEAQQSNDEQQLF